MDFDLHNMLDDFAAMLSVRAHEKELEFICAAAPDVPSCVRGDPGRLQQILTNLAGNAVKFTHQGEVVVYVTLQSETDTEAFLRFSVKDTGVGIPEDKKSHLFNKFYQVDASTTRQYGGTGLGLAISKQLVEMMKGEIGLKSEEGKGSEFWFTINIAKQSDRERKNIHSAEIQVRVSWWLMITPRIVRYLTSVCLHGVQKRKKLLTGPMALQALYRAHEDGEPFQVAILDMHMPGMDGESVAKCIKSDKKLKETRLVMLSSLGQCPEPENLKDNHFTAYLTKPIRYLELFGVLSTILNMEEQRQKLQASVNARSTPYQQHNNLRILLAEDNIVNQKVAQSMLQKIGYRVDTVANGIEAIKALEMLPYDLVFMDVQMPEMDGFEATRYIRNSQSAVHDHEIPIIAMTARAMKGDKERCLQAGMNDYISKPVSLQSLIILMEKWQILSQKGSNLDETFPEETKNFAISPIFDREALIERTMGDEQIAKKIIAIFLKDLPKQINALKEIIEKGEMDNVSWYAHNIKGSSANIGAMALSTVAAEMEKAGNNRKTNEITQIMQELENQYELLLIQLKGIEI